MFARLSLRLQLLISYVLLLGISLGTIIVALLISLATLPAPVEPTYQRLAALMKGLNNRETILSFTVPLRNVPGSATGPMRDDLAEFSGTWGVRVLVLTVLDNNSTLVAYDSAGVFTSLEPMLLRTMPYASSQLQSSLARGLRQVYGSFIDPQDNTEWLAGGVASEIVTRRGAVPFILLLAEQRGRVSLQETLSDLSSALLPPIFQAGVVGLVVAIIMAFLISQGLVRPLHLLAAGARAVARGDYEYHVPEIGPAEIRGLAGAFNRMRGEVKSAGQSQRDFMANVSHDLKTPLTSIQGYAQAIMDFPDKDPSGSARIIYDEAARLNRLVVELTDLVRMQSGRLSMKSEALDMGEIAAAIGQRLAVVARKKQVSLKLKTAPMPPIAGDGDRMAQVLTNLISNAIKFTPTGGTVLVRTAVNNGGVEVSVQDTGVGIPAADLPRIFERFYQVDKVRGPERGTGLGLAIVREIVQAHGGTITVASPGEGRGTTFTIWLPSPLLSTIVSRGH
ncbi:MAG: HAMP domain-containing histidine kinase [Anaerolineae bacterium]|nr:HAMP domain-containing histidine kinase [Anaerolineae bacterium]